MTNDPAGDEHIQTIDGATNHCSSGEHGAHFGLAAAETLEWVRVEWTDGTSTTIPNVSANRLVTVEAPFHPADFNNDGVLDGTDATAFAAAHLAVSPAADLDGSGTLDLADVTTWVRWYLGS